MKLVSVLIPVYNSKNFIEEAVQSVLSQTYPNIEIIIVDDGSSDGSHEVVQKFESSKVKIYKQENKGACSARNKAFELSVGDYIQYLDADDILSENKIKMQIKLIDGRDDCVASCSWVKFSGEFCKFQPNRVQKQHIDRSYNNPSDWLVESWCIGGHGLPSVWLTPRKVVEKAGLWNESLKLNQDGEFFSRVLMNSKKIIYSPEAHVYYRKGIATSISASSVFSEEKAASLLDSYIMYEENTSPKGGSPNLKKALANNYLSFIYQYYSKHPDLIKKAFERFYSLGFSKPWPVGGKKFRQIAKLIGFKNALYFKSIFGR